MRKIILLTFNIFIILTLASCNLFVKKSETQINILDEVNRIKEKSNCAVIKPINFNTDDILLYIRRPITLESLIYKANIKNSSIDLIKKFSGEYKFITAIHYSNNDNKVYVGIYSEVPYQKQKEMPPSYLLKLNTNMEIEDSVKVDYEISNFFEVGQKIYIECNTEHIHNRGNTNNKIMRELDKDDLSLNEIENKYIIYESYKTTNGNTVLIKVEREDVEKLESTENAVDVIAEIVDKNEKVIKSEYVKKVYPYNIVFTELSNGSIVFNLQKGHHMDLRNQIYVFEKNNQNYELIHKKNIKLPNSFVFSGIIENDNGLGILISELELYEGKNEILLYDNNFNKLLKKYEIDNTSGLILTSQVNKINGKTILIFDNGDYIKIGEINLEE